MAIWSPKFIDVYFSKGKEIRKLDENKKEMLNKLLKSGWIKLTIPSFAPGSVTALIRRMIRTNTGRKTVYLSTFSNLLIEPDVIQ